jgi:uncharacterized protein (TIGR00369 family)
MTTTGKSSLGAAEVQKLIRVNLPESETAGLEVEAVGEGRARVRVPYHPRMLRPGDSMSGPALMAAADVAMYALLLAELGPVDLALTSNFNCHFLTRALPGDILAEARLLRLGRRVATLQVEVRTTARDDLAAQVTGSYVLPDALQPTP